MAVIAFLWVKGVFMASQIEKDSPMNNLPILEHDYESESIIEPSRVIKPRVVPDYPGIIRSRVEEGCLTVEMEAAELVC